MARSNVLLAALSVLTHSDHEDINDILDTLASVLPGLDRARAEFISEFVDLGLAGTDAQQYWRKLMKLQSFYPHRRTLFTEWAEEGRMEGRVEGRKEAEIQAVLDVLAARDLAVTDTIEQQVRACSDEAELKAMLLRAVTVKSADDLFSNANATAAG